ncbi:hypothetical protein FRC04_007238 [Tulasnella sp. 424]|nr:hypothetical protein FRC04_007238 [Tulasnella sp. 424]
MSEALYSYARQCSLSAANTTVVQLSQTEGDLRTSQDFTDVDTIIASRGEHDSERRITHVSQRKPFTKPNDGTGLTSSRPHSSSSRAARSPTTASARWSSYTSPLTPRSQLPSSPVSDEVESLKTQLAASEALVKQLTKEKFEAVDASRKLFADVESLQSERNQWMQEREVLMAKLGLLDEVEATPGLLPSSEEVWFAGSNQTPPQTQPPLLSPIAISPDYRNPETLPSETQQVPEVAVSQPAATPMAPYLPAIDPASSSLAYLSPPRANRRSHMCRDAVDGSQFGQPAASNRAYSEPLVSEVATIDDDILARIGSAFLASTPVDNHEGCDPGNTQPPATTPYPHSLLNALGLFCAPESPVEVLIPPSARSLSAPAQALRPQPDLIDLVSQRVGSDSCPGHVGHRDLDNRAKSFLKEVKASAGSRTRLTRRDDSRIELDWTTKGGIGVHEMAGHEGIADPPSVRRLFTRVRE